MEVEKCNELVDNENNETVKQNMTTSAAMSTTSNGWHQSRIIRVSRASGGKDRHSKVWTSKGLRDRRVRLSVQTAIQFYDLQDRLGYDQPSKAVEWLIKSAADAIAELPSLNAPSLFPDTPKQQQLSHEKKKRTSENSNVNQLNQTQTQSQLQPCSSTSDTSRGSEKRVKARERARDRTAKVKEVEIEIGTTNNNAETFTELLATGIGSNINNCNTGHNSNQMGYSFGFPQSTLFSIDNLNLSALSSSGFNGGTLQSNATTSSSLSPLPLLNHLQRFSQPLESSVPFFFGAAESHQQHQFPAGLQLYGDHKGKPKHSSLFSENRSEKSNGSCKRMHMLPSSDVSLL